MIAYVPKNKGFLESMPDSKVDEKGMRYSDPSKIALLRIYLQLDKSMFET